VSGARVRSRLLGVAVLAPAMLALAMPCAAAPPGHEAPAPPALRALPLEDSTLGIAYGPYRDGQRPGGRRPTTPQLREDLHLLAGRWSVLRVYGSTAPTPEILRIIERERLGLGVLLGVSITPEERRDSTGRSLGPVPGAAATNRGEIESAIALARRYPAIVRALVVGNETQVFWSANRVPRERLTEAIREVRASVRQPVTSGDDFAFWEAPDSRPLADELDFVMVHLHPLWNGCAVDTALAWLGRHQAAVAAMHPGRPIVIGETGWATQRNDEGDQGRLMKGALGEAEQARYLEDIRHWCAESRVPTVLFEAFDENWKGGTDLGDVEKHWGLYRADRTPKAALRGLP
jgi:exo-beta-1,3-glucanase (GH17 family)